MGNYGAHKLENDEKLPCAVSSSFAVLLYFSLSLSLSLCAQVISVKDNDSLAARLSVDLGADLLILLSDVDGLYTAPPGTEGSRLVHSYSPKHNGLNFVFGENSRVGTGGMDSKVCSFLAERGEAGTALWSHARVVTSSESPDWSKGMKILVLLPPARIVHLQMHDYQEEHGSVRRSLRLPFIMVVWPEIPLVKV